MATYTDLSLTLQSHPYTHDIVKISDLESVKQSMKNILFSGPYTSPFNVTFGANIRTILFEHLTQSIIAVYKRKIRLALEEYEPRIKIEDIYIGESTENAIDIGILFYVIGLPDRQTFNFTLERVR